MDEIHRIIISYANSKLERAYILLTCSTMIRPVIPFRFGPEFLWYNQEV